MIGSCACGCGKATRHAPYSHKARGWNRGQPLKYLRGHAKGAEPVPPEERIWGKVIFGTGCWIWTSSRTVRGYPQIGYRQEKISVHRLVFQLFHGEIPDGKFVCHKCDNPSCVRPSHLFLGDAKINADDCTAKGRRPVGQERSEARLTDDIVRSIRVRSEAGESPAKLASEFGVSRAAIRFAVKRETWKHVQ